MHITTLRGRLRLGLQRRRLVRCPLCHQGPSFFSPSWHRASSEQVFSLHVAQSVQLATLSPSPRAGRVYAATLLLHNMLLGSRHFNQAAPWQGADGEVLSVQILFSACGVWAFLAHGQVWPAIGLFE
jgi:hypothetical protein